MTQLTVSQAYYLILRCVVDIKTNPECFIVVQIHNNLRLIFFNIFNDYSRLSKKYLILSNYDNIFFMYLNCNIDIPIQGI